MRTAPLLTLDIPPQTGWRWGVRLLGLMAGASLLGWLWQGDAVAVDGVHLAVGIAASGVLLAALGRVDATPCRLGWDGSAWTLEADAGRGAMRASGRLRVTLDVSVAMLLRFEPEAGADAGRPVRWIPVSSRRFPPAQWQALRRTVYSAPPHAGGSPGGDGPRTE